MATPLMFSKLQPPPARREIVARPRLVERLEAGLHSGDVFLRKLTLISAPAGSGKTTLAGFILFIAFETRTGRRAKHQA